MPKPRRKPIPALADMLEAFDPASVMALSASLTFVANTADQLGEADRMSIGCILNLATALASFKLVLDKYQI